MTFCNNNVGGNYCADSPSTYPTLHRPQPFVPTKREVFVFRFSAGTGGEGQSYHSRLARLRRRRRLLERLFSPNVNRRGGGGDRDDAAAAAVAAAATTAFAR